MADLLPISCISCRRKKIKCNKLKPCNQCAKRRIPCQFPSTFRNIKINDEDVDSNRSDNSHTSEKLRSDENSSSSDNFYESAAHEDHDNPVNIAKLNEEIELLRNEKLVILKDNFKLNQKNHQLLSQIAKFTRSGAKDPDAETTKELFPISGETSELGEKYYGPQSSNFMIETLKKKSELTDESIKKVQTSKPNEFISFGDSSSENKYSSDLDKSNDEDNDISNHTNSDNPHLIQRSLLKKPLPSLVKVDPDVSSDSETTADLQKINLQVIYRLVELFFINNTQYKSFIEKKRVIEFLDNYDNIKDKEWENDDDLLLLLMILLLSIQRLTPREFIEMNLISYNSESIKKFGKFKEYLSNVVLYHGFEKLRHNLINESIMTIQAYILCTEWYFVEQRYEESWSMMFHTCSVAYSIGLHVMGKFRTSDTGATLVKKNDVDGAGTEDHVPRVSKVVKREDQEDDNDDEDQDDKDNDISRFKVWFALKNISGQLCSVLGRPNPISIQVNSMVLKSSSGSSLAKMDLSADKTQALLKIGLSECLRLSNMMLIENFMINFTMADLLKLDAKFDKEIKLLEWFVSDEYDEDAENDQACDDDVKTGMKDSSGDQISYEEGTNLPLAIDRVNVLGDLMIFYINRAKLFEPFVNQFEGAEEAHVITQSLHFSIIKFLDYTIEFIQIFLDNFTEKYLSFDYKVLSEIKFGKLFRIYYPFLNLFIYQGIIVIFTFLNYKLKAFVHHQNSSPMDGAQVTGGDRDPGMTVVPQDESKNIDSNKFLYQLENKLNALLLFDRKVSALVHQNVRLWSTNIIYLINKNVQHINLIYEKQKLEKQKLEQEISEFSQHIDRVQSRTDDEPAIDSLLGFNLGDPFWLTNPDNLPYYLSSPSDDSTLTLPNKKARTDSTSELPAIKKLARFEQPHSGSLQQQPALNHPDQTGFFGMLHLNEQLESGRFLNMWPHQNSQFRNDSKRSINVYEPSGHMVRPPPIQAQTPGQQQFSQQQFLYDGHFYQPDLQGQPLFSQPMPASGRYPIQQQMDGQQDQFPEQLMDNLEQELSDPHAERKI